MLLVGAQRARNQAHSGIFLFFKRKDRVGFSHPRRQEGPSSAHDDKKRAPLLAWLLLDTSTMVEGALLSRDAIDPRPPSQQFLRLHPGII